MKALGIMVNILGTPCYNTVCWYTVKTVKIQNSVKTGKTGCVCVVLCSLYAPCNKNIL